MYVCFIWENRRALKSVTVFCDINAVYIITQHCTVRIPKRKGSDVEDAVKDGIVIADKCVVFVCDRDGDAVGVENRSADVCGDIHNIAVFDCQMNFLDSAECFDSEIGFGGKPLHINQLAGASQSVSAHLGFASVGIENSHSEIGNCRRTYHDHAVTADTFVSVGNKTCGGSRIFYLLVESDNIYIIVAVCLHLGEFHCVPHISVLCTECRLCSTSDSRALMHLLYHKSFLLQ